MPEDYLALDGNSLSTDDLRQLGKGRYKIRITKGLFMSNYPKFYPISFLDFKKWVKSIQTAGYNGAGTVIRSSN